MDEVDIYSTNNALYEKNKTCLQSFVNDEAALYCVCSLWTTLYCS